MSDSSDDDYFQKKLRSVLGEPEPEDPTHDIDVKRLRLKPDDIIVVRVGRRRMTPMERRAWMEKVEDSFRQSLRILGYQNEVLIHSDDIELSVLEIEKSDPSDAGYELDSDEGEEE